MMTFDISTGCKRTIGESDQEAGAHATTANMIEITQPAACAVEQATQSQTPTCVYNFYTAVTLAGAQTVKALVDGGASVNLISGNVARRLGLQFIPSSAFPAEQGAEDSGAETPSSIVTLLAYRYRPTAALYRSVHETCGDRSQLHNTRGTRIQQAWRIPTDRRPKNYRRQLLTGADFESEEDFEKQLSEIFHEFPKMFGNLMTTPEQKRAVQALYLTWKDAFVQDISKIQETDLIIHNIPTKGVQHKAPKPSLYTAEEIEY
ncbi:hypothetical protein TI39_contig5856g00006 [Zymoseptoria brevis]|uniref:Uncharacterized protein n=1 Tax=Zymoseptoria brevis TaxID=1047168 RepID=A0A0F4G819_9PEZI|nr:hypothetical protein TI39_contig5856g00006 [Zymoseptoria brevis]